MAATQESSTTCVSILDLPANSSIRLDGQIILLHRDDFVGIAGVPVVGLHFLAIRPCIQTKKVTNEPVFGSVATGFVLPDHGPLETQFLVRRYDPFTEEVSDQPIDEATRFNLIQQIQQKTMDPQRLLPYASVMRSEAAVHSWHESTHLVSLDLLLRRGIPPGTKIVPGSYDDETTNFVNDSLQDGKSPQYPPIPVLQAGKRRTTHRGTKAFLQNLSPTQRTSLLMDAHPCSAALDMVVSQEYQGNWEELLGDMQLSYTLFLNLQCYASLEHWRDLVALSCRASSPSLSASMLHGLIKVLTAQIKTMEGEFFNDADLSDDNFFVPSLQMLSRTLSCETLLTQEAIEFGALLRERFPHHEFASKGSTENVSGQSLDIVMVEVTADPDMEEGEDGPVVVPFPEVQAATATVSATSHGNTHLPNSSIVISPVLRERYPILTAAVQAHEDIVMTCARALDEANDVSLVREAAAYLEEVEARRVA